MNKKYKIIALYGKAGVGKDTIQNWICNKYNFNSVISCTTRPSRDYEINGKDYHFLSISEFTKKVLNGSMLEATEFNNWFYGTPIESLSIDKINIGVFNIAGISAMLEDSRLEVYPVVVYAPDKTRLLRQLNREENPDCDEICRRFFTDKKDFLECEFDPFFLWENFGIYEKEEKMEETFSRLIDKINKKD